MVDSETRSTHFNEAGQAHMVDVGEKQPSLRIALASGRISMNEKAFELIQQGTAKKGDVLGIARIAAIQAAKRTSELIPLCHPIAITSIAIDFIPEPGRRTIECRAEVQCHGRTGVEMEAMTAVQIGLLTIYDMCKSVDRAMVIDRVHLVQKSGGKSGDYSAAGAAPAG